MPDAQGAHALGVLTHVADELVDQGGPEREPLEQSLNGGAVLRDPLVVVGAGSRGSGRFFAAMPASRRSFPARAAESGRTRPAWAGLSSGSGSPPSGQKNDLVQRDLLVPDPVDHGQEPGRRERDASERAAKRDLSHLDALANCYFFMRL